MIRGSGYSKIRLATAAGAEVAVQQRNKKWHAAVTRSTFASQNAQNTTFSEQLLKFQCRKMGRHCGATHICKSNFSKCGSRKMARRCGAKHICKSKCAKHHILGPIFEVSIWKNGTPLWRKAHL